MLLLLWGWGIDVEEGGRLGGDAGSSGRRQWKDSTWCWRF